jgi:hypothetical protein
MPLPEESRQVPTFPIAQYHFKFIVERIPLVVTYELGVFDFILFCKGFNEREY